MPEVFAGRIRVGAIESGLGGPSFRYADGWRANKESFPVSLSMPLTGAEWGPEVLVPWLMNLLPEGDPLRAMTRALGIAAEDVIGLITASGRDVAGALSMSAPGDTAAHVPIADALALERIINELPARPFLAGAEGVAMSLAGAQDKLPLVLEGERFAIPINGAASTHILKPDNPRLHGSVQNEALCMVLARRCGLEVAGVTTGIAGARSYLLVTRYDRTAAGGAVARLHQEDFCQALARPPGAKYETNQTGARGPSLADMFALIREHMTARDINRFLDAVIFNIAIGNVDSHAKNYSILLSANNAELAPLYDLMSGLAWPNITENHAQTVGGQRRGRYIFRRHWQRLAAAGGLSAPAVLRRVVSMTESVLAELPQARDELVAMPAGEGVLLGPLVQEISDRARTVQFNAGEDGPEGEDTAPGADGRFDT